MKRDSCYSGVQEGVIGTERIINMLNVVDDNLVIEEKGIYSIEKFLIARRLMYWQVYLHKTVLSAEKTLIKTLKRAKELIEERKEIFATPALLFFLKNNFAKKDFDVLYFGDGLVRFVVCGLWFNLKGWPTVV